MDNKKQQHRIDCSIILKVVFSKVQYIMLGISIFCNKKFKQRQNLEKYISEES